jgi:SAM-dependent methyltransferase
VTKVRAIKQWADSRECCDSAWEEAYARFETPEEEIEKFLRRLRGFGVERWSRDLAIVELFCGRGGGLEAWHRLGYFNLEGVDISAGLLHRYQGDAQLYLGDCRSLQLPDASRDVVCVHGGLHHLPAFPDDVKLTVAEVRRVLRPGGRFLIVEPWTTPFLNLIHACALHSPLRRVSRKLDAFACMTEREHETYFRWLSRPAEILALLTSTFQTEMKQEAWGKLSWLGRKLPE